MSLADNGPDPFWQSLDPYSQVRVRTGLSLVPPADTPALNASAGPGQAGFGRLTAKVWHPDNPLFWFGLFAAGTAAAMALSSGTVRATAGGGAKVGPASAEATVTV